MAVSDLEITEDSTVTSGELSQMMLLLERHDRYIFSRMDGRGINFFYWKETKNHKPCSTCGKHQDPKQSNSFLSFLACLYDAVAPWHGENG